MYTFYVNKNDLNFVVTMITYTYIQCERNNIRLLYFLHIEMKNTFFRASSTRENVLKI
jgi:hypothetical protein